MPSPNSTTANCGNTVNKLEATGHLTSGNPQVVTGKVVSVDSQTNAVGASKPQNVMVYNDPHLASATQEAFPTPGRSTGKGTDFLHDPSNPHRISTVIDETKNK